MTDNTEEEIHIEIEDAADEEVVIEKSAPADEITPEEGISALKKRLEDEKRARENAERQAYEAQKQVQLAQKDVQDNEYHLVVGAIERAKQTADNLKNGYAEAMAAGDYRKAADFQEAIAMNANKLVTMENGKQAMEARLKQPVEPIAPPPQDAVEQFASQLTRRSADWVRAHPEVIKDSNSYQAMVRAHNYAMGEGHVPDSDSYFEAVETRLGYRKQPEPIPEEEVISVAATPTQKRTSVPPSAPSTKMASSNAGKPNTVRLTPEMREMASMMGMTPEEYAKNRVALQRDGKIN